jgi:two-component system nitrate/nitrite response regulator NarL
LLEQTRVLLADDNAAVRDYIATVLASCCVIVGAVQDGPAVLDAAATLRPDVIVLDVSMPGMSGFEVATRLREAGSAAAIVFLTLHEDDAFVDAARKAGGLGYVLKRLLGADLETAVREARAGRPFVSKLDS